MRDDNRVTENRELSIGRVDGQIAVAEGLAGDNVLMENVKVDEGRFCRVCDGSDAAGWRLSDYFRACEETCQCLDGMNGCEERLYPLGGRIWRRRCLGSWWALIHTLLIMMVCLCG